MKWVRTISFVVSACISVFASAHEYAEGSVLRPIELVDQFDEHVVITDFSKIAIVVFDREASDVVNTFLQTQSPEYLAKHGAFLIADISEMPGFVAQAFALPKMRKYPYRVLLIKDEEQGMLFPGEEHKITIMYINHNKIKKISYITTANELKAILDVN